MRPPPPTSRDLRAAEALYAGGKLEAEAERITALATRLERTLALGELAEARTPGASWIHGRCCHLWARRIAALEDLTARREALEQIPVAQSRIVESEVRRLFAARKGAP